MREINCINIKKRVSWKTSILVAFVLLLSAIGQAGAVDLNGEIFDAGSDNLSWDATNWNYMFTDINDYTSWTERFYYNNSADGPNGPIGVSNENTIDEGELIYSSTPYVVPFGLTLNEGVVVDDSGTYAGFPFMQGFYVAVDSDATAIAPLLFEYYWPEDVTTLTVGETFDLGAGYSIKCNQVDVEGDKVWLSLLKDGEELESEVLDTRTENGSLFVARDDFAGKNDAIYFMTYADKLFQGTSDSFVKLQYTWLADKDDVKYITTDDTFGVFECTQADEDEIIFSNSKQISLKMDGATYLTDDMYLYASDEGLSASGGFHIYPGITMDAPGSYEIRGEVFDAGADNLSWDATSWNFMFADINDYTSWTERFYYNNSADGPNGPIGIANENTIDEGELIYSATPYVVPFGLTLNEGVVVDDSGTYAGFPFMQGFYVAVDSDATAIAPLIFEYYWPEDVTTLAVGETFDLGANYSIQCNQVDVEGDKVWLSLLKDGEELESEVLDTKTENGSLFVARDDFAGKNDAIYFMTYADKLFQGTSDSFVKLQYTWLADKDNVRYVTTDDTFGVFECTQADENEIIFSNSKQISLKMDDATYLTDDMYLYASDEGLSASGGFHIYPALGVTIEAETSEDEIVVVDLENVEETVDDAEATDETQDEEMVETIESDSGEDTESEPVAANVVPGFGILLSIFVLCLAIAYSKKQ